MADGADAKILLKKFVASRAVVTVSNAGARPVKVVAADGTVREATSADVLLGLVRQAEIQVDMDDVALRKRDEERRRAGLPDLCDGCSDPLGMRYRRAKPHPWLCRSCSNGGKGGRKGNAHQCEDCASALPMGRSCVSRRLRGLQKHLCSKCAALRRRKTPALPHDPSDQPDKCAHCERPLSTTVSAARVRRRKPRPWFCGSLCKRHHTTDIARWAHPP